MWYVYNINDSWHCGFTVANEDEAAKHCAQNPDYTYKYVG